MSGIGRHRRRGLLADAPAFRRMWASRCVSLTGDGVSRTALVLLAARYGPHTVGVVLLANTLPRLVGPWAGALADRLDQRRVMAACELAQCAVIAAMAATLPPVPVLVVLVAVTGLAAGTFAPAGRSAVPALVAPERYGEANALLGTAFNLQVVAGPAIGGVLVALAGLRWAFVLTAVTFGVSALLLTGLPPLRSAAGAGPAPSLATATREGFRYVARAPAPRGLVVAIGVAVSFAAIDNVALVFLVEHTLHGGDADYGAAQAAYGAGMIVASLAMTRVVGRLSPLRWFTLGLVLTGIGTAVTAGMPSVATVALAQAVAGAGNAGQLVALDTLVQQTVPRELLGRVFGILYTCAQAGSGLASAVGGPLVGATGPRIALLVAGLGVAGGLPALAPLARRTGNDRRRGATSRVSARRA